MPVTLGSSRLLSSGRLRGRTIGIVANPASVDHALVHIVDHLLASRDLTVGAVFGPQHGFRSDVQDNMIETPHAELGSSRRVPVYSLYSDTREPTLDMVRGLDTLVIDLQDIGARIYTYVYTMANCMRACARHGIEVLVCDRPNPIGGLDVAGMTLRRGSESFVGQFPIPMRHGMTIGELALLFNGHFGLGAPLHVIAMEGWSRAMYADETGLTWVMPSPNIPTLESAVVFPGTVLVEGTTASEGRGTTRPFEIVGAPWVPAERFAQAMNDRGLPGVRFRPVVFEPTFNKHARTPCGGCQIHVLDRRRFEPVVTGVALIEGMRLADTDRFDWKAPPYEYEHDRQPIDVLAGSGRLREALEAGVRAEDLAREWEADVAQFKTLRAPFLLYE
ncbi:MAG: DUF1343 domain-containing protein [Acidobacteria bacterium]|nr:DUF1343 domain-containing protein [Acidobacteriota bacterium]